jgi:hypothetical protein
VIKLRLVPTYPLSRLSKEVNLSTGIISRDNRHLNGFITLSIVEITEGGKR